jgi:hypothetical protein
MAYQFLPARNMICQVQQVDGITWTQVEGQTQIGLDASANEVMTETTTYGSNGNYEELPMQRGKAISLQGMKMVDSITGLQAPGQARCATLAEGVAYSGVGAVRFRDPLETQWKVWSTATFSVGDQSGGNNDMRGWTCTIRRSGAGTLTAAP